MKIFNTLSAQLDEFSPLKDGKVSIYVCGPTVYDKGHVGHGRSMVAFDVVRRYFLYKGYDVNFVTNYTDIDDKMINRANDEGITVTDLALKIMPMYERDFDALNVMRPSSRPLATEYVDEMMGMVKKLISDGFAYEISDGVYFDTLKFEEYGKLSKQRLDELSHGERVAVNDEKKNPTDFVLWKHKKEGEPSWTDSDGVLKEGRPGWHIECSAMSKALLGDTFDIHAGGVDLVFPHHECEIAQSECANGEPFARFWMHNGYVNIDGEKMSKSLNNFKTLEDILKVYPGNVVRYALISTNYRSPINFDDKLFEQSASAVARVQGFYDRVKGLSEFGSGSGLFVSEFKADFEKFMDNDFDVAGALGVMFSFIKTVNSLIDDEGLSESLRDDVLLLMDQFDSVFAILNLDDVEISDEAMDLINRREKARSDRDFELADKLRDELADMGIEIEDTKDGTKWRVL